MTAAFIERFMIDSLFESRFRNTSGVDGFIVGCRFEFAIGHNNASLCDYWNGNCVVIIGFIVKAIL